jgi:hypothetical protein
MRATLLSRSRAVATLVGAAWVAGVPGRARSAEAESESGAAAAHVFSWSAPENCPTREDVLAALAGVARLDASSWSRFESIVGRVTGEAPEWTLALEFTAHDARLSRTFESRACSDFASAAAVALALALDPSWDWSSGQASSSATPAKPEDAPVPRPQPAVEPRGGLPLHARVGLGALLDSGTLGATRAGLDLHGALVSERLSAGVYAAWLPERRLEVSATESAGLALLTGGLRGCYAPSAGLFVCPELDVGALLASGVDSNESRSPRDWWIAPGASLALEVPAGETGVYLAARVSVRAPLVRPEYFVDEVRRIHDVPRLTLRLSLEASLPVL